MMHPPLTGVMVRRMLINYRVDPTIAATLLPDPFRPQLVAGHAVAGICLLTLGSLRTHALPAWMGLRSDNAAHRIAVEWDGPRGVQTGVYVPRRDSASRVNVAVGGRLFPGRLHRARFIIRDSGTEHSVRYSSADGAVTVAVSVTETDTFTGSHLFPDLVAASRFFQLGSIAYAPTKQPTRFDGLKLGTSAWAIHPARVNEAHSSYFDNLHLFPRGTAHLDCALIMRSVPVRWTALPPLQAAQRPNVLVPGRRRIGSAGRPGRVASTPARSPSSLPGAPAGNE